MLKAYIQLTKPGIIFGNLIAVTGGYLLATRGHFDITLFLLTQLGVMFIIAGGCVVNNIIDRDIDKLMQRTNQRASATGRITAVNAFVFGSVLMFAGLFVLWYYVNLVCTILGFLGLIIYVGLYSLYFKRNSIHGTFIGSFSGAIPPMIGYVAVIGRIDISAIIILAMFSVWQMPHAFAIALNRYNDYKNAQIPVLPHVKGIQRAKQDSFIYTIIFLIFSVALGFFGKDRIIYTICAFCLGIYWCVLAWQLLKSEGKKNTQDESVEGVSQAMSDDPLSEMEKKASKKMFLFSILLITFLSIAMGIPL